MKRLMRILSCMICMSVLASIPGYAHFQCLIPSDEIIMIGDNRRLTLELKFMHPFAGSYMEMAKPVSFGVRADGKTVDLNGTLNMRTQDGFSTFQSTYMIEKPGDHIFFVEPAPYFEAAEKRFIVHYTKTVVHALGLEEGWDEEVGLKTEIIPLTRPYGLWTGNVFQGMVKAFGKPVPYAEIEIEYYAQGSMDAPANPFITQVIRADQNGVFSYAFPKSGWWVFAALGEDRVKRRHSDGSKYPVEIGAVMWVRVYDMP